MKPWLAVLLAAALLGCGSPKKAEPPAPEPKAKPETKRGVLTEAGTATQRSAEGDRPVLWNIHWEAASLTLEGDKPDTGSFRGVSGDLFREGRKASTFKAERGEADGSAEMLELIGSVEILETEHQATLLCDHATYEGKTGMVKARGNVRILYAGFTIGPMPEAWATAALDQAGTPDTFKP